MRHENPYPARLSTINRSAWSVTPINQIYFKPCNHRMPPNTPKPKRHFFGDFGVFGGYRDFLSRLQDYSRMTDQPPERMFALQQRFAGHLRDPENVAGAGGTGGPSPGNLPATVLQQSEKICSRANFPVIRKLTSDQQWDALIREFMADHRSHNADVYRDRWRVCRISRRTGQTVNPTSPAGWLNWLIGSFSRPVSVLTTRM